MAKRKHNPPDSLHPGVEHHLVLEGFVEKLHTQVCTLGCAVEVMDSDYSSQEAADRALLVASTAMQDLHKLREDIQDAVDMLGIALRPERGSTSGQTAESAQIIDLEARKLRNAAELMGSCVAEERSGSQSAAMSADLPIYAAESYPPGAIPGLLKVRGLIREAHELLNTIFETDYGTEQIPEGSPADAAADNLRQALNWFTPDEGSEPEDDDEPPPAAEAA